MIWLYRVKIGEVCFSNVRL